MKRVLTYGTFDTLHFGHIRLLQRAKKLGDYLIVGLSTDHFNQIKNKKAYHTWEERKFFLESLRFVDLVIPEDNWDQKIEDVKLYHADVFTMGDDWAGKFDFLANHCEVIYLPRTQSISSTEIRKILSEVS